MTEIEILMNKYGSNFFIETQKENYTYDHVMDYAKKISKYLKNTDKIGICVSNCMEFYPAVIAGILSKCEVFVFHKNWKEEHIIQEIANLGINVFLTNSKNHYLSDNECDFKDKINTLEIIRLKKKVNNNFAKQYIYISTSGTTGNNKWICHKIENIMSNMKALGNALKISQSDRLYSALPLYTANGITITFFLPLVVGASVFIGDIFSPFTVKDYFLNVIAKKITILSLVPNAISILNSITTKKMEVALRSSRLRFTICGTAPLKKSSKSHFESLTNSPVFLNYGLTETLFVSTQNWESQYDESSGQLLDNVLVCSNRNGEIIVKSPFLNIDAETNIQYQYWKTGDIGYLKNNELFINGRIKEMVNVGGYNINLNDLDEWFENRGYIKEACCLGISKQGREMLLCVIVLNENYNSTEALKTLNQEMKRELASYMRPKILIRDEIPRNIQGKPLKEKMRSMIEKGEVL